MKKIFLSIMVLLSLSKTNAQLGLAKDLQNGFEFFNANTFAIHNGVASVATPALPVHLHGYAQLNDLTTGKPIIITNGIRVYNQAHADITGGPLLLGHTASTNSATIVQISPDSALIITTSPFFAATNPAYYTLVKGLTSTPVVDATVRNVPINAGGIVNFLEKSLITPQGTGGFVRFLVLHEASNTPTNTHCVFRVTNIFPYLTWVSNFSVGTPVTKIGGRGQMKCTKSQNNSGPAYLIGSAYARVNPTSWGAVDLIWMDVNSGILTAKESISTSGDYPYGLEFSRSGNFMYVTSLSANRRMLGFAINLLGSSTYAPAVVTAAPLARLGQIQRISGDKLIFPCYGTNRLMQLNAASSGPSPSASTPYFSPAGVTFRWGLSNYNLF